MADKLCVHCGKRVGMLNGHVGTYGSLHGKCESAFQKSRQQRPAAPSAEPEESASNPRKSTERAPSRIGQERPVTSSKYGAAQGISSIAEVIGWVLIAVGIVTVFLTFGTLRALAFLGGISISVSGLFLVMASQFVRAIVDNADTTREILALLRKKD